MKFSKTQLLKGTIGLLGGVSTALGMYVFVSGNQSFDHVFKVEKQSPELEQRFLRAIENTIRCKREITTDEADLFLKISALKPDLERTMIVNGFIAKQGYLLTQQSMKEPSNVVLHRAGEVLMHNSNHQLARYASGYLWKQR
ncbi:MAG: hypothetical protein AB2689_02115 [Candidatus Thiodiazotropha taylori]